MDSREEGEVERRRLQFRDWLIKGWEWAIDAKHPVSDTLAELIGHAEELDYPLWEMADKLGIINKGEMAKWLRKRCGWYPSGPRAVGWEKEINYSPIVYLDEETWTRVYNSLGWVNRYADAKVNTKHFWLWSPSANVVRFVMRKVTTMEQVSEER